MNKINKYGIVFLFVGILIAFTQKAEANFDADRLINNKEKVVLGSDIKYIYKDDIDELTMELISPSGEILSQEFDFDDDSGYLTGTFVPEELGTYGINGVYIDGVLYESDLGKFEVVEELSDVYNTDSSEAIVDDMPNEMFSSELVENLSKVKFYDSLGNGILVNVEVISDSGSYFFEIDNDGFTTSTTVFDSAELEAGFYTAVFTGENEVYTKEFNIVEPVNALSGSINLLSRISGTDRTATAVAVSRKIGSSSGWAVLANSGSYNDSFVGVSLASALDGPLLFVGRNDLPQATLNELNKIKARNVYIIGGYGAVSSAVENQLKNQGFNVRRISGSNTKDSANNVARELKRYSNFNTAILTDNNNFPDALTSSSYAGINEIPILYSDKEYIEKSTLQTMKDLNINRVIIVGGENSISTSVRRSVEALGISVDRVAGLNRYETSKLFTDQYFSNASNLVIASGEVWPDALVGGRLGDIYNAPVLLTGGKTLSNEVYNYLKKVSKGNIFVIGGEDTINSSTYNSIYNRIEKLNSSGTYRINRREDIRTSGGPIKIFLDQGHGWNYNKGVVDGYYEGTSMYWYGLILRNELRQYGFIVDAIRNDLDAERRYCVENGLYSTNGLPVAKRGPMAADYDLLVSLHTNANYNQNVSGTEVYDSCQSTTYDLASNLSRTIAGHFNHTNRGVKYRFNIGDGPIKGGNLSYSDLGPDWYGVLRTSGADRSMMIEQGFHTNYHDCSKLMDVDFKMQLAEKTAKVIADYFGYTK